MVFQCVFFRWSSKAFPPTREPPQNHPWPRAYKLPQYIPGPKAVLPPKYYALVVRWKKNNGCILTPSSLTPHVPLGVFSCSAWMFWILLSLRTFWPYKFSHWEGTFGVFPRPIKNTEPLRPIKSCNNFGEFMVFTYASKGSPSQKRNIMLFLVVFTTQGAPSHPFRIPLLNGIQGQL